MSVLWIGGLRFAAGLEWDRGLVSGGAARRTARQRKRPLSVDVLGQTGFGEEVGGAEGTKPLAGALAMLLRGREDAKNWIAFVEEDSEAGPEGRLVLATVQKCAYSLKSAGPSATRCRTGAPGVATRQAALRLLRFRYGPSGDEPQPQAQWAFQGRKETSGHRGRIREVNRSAVVKCHIYFQQIDAVFDRHLQLAVVRCYGGLLLSDAVFADLPEALEALGDAAVEDEVLVVATSELAARFKDELRAKVDAVVEDAGIVKAADGVDALKAVPTSGWTRKRLARVAAAIALVGAGWWGWTNQERLLLWAGLAEEEKERPKVRVAVDTRRFLTYCRDELARRELWLAGFDRVAVSCHSSFDRTKETGAPKRLRERPVLEVRWVLREGLPARVFGPLAEQLMESWYWAGVKNDGKVVAVSPLPQVLALSGKKNRPKAKEFRARMDGVFSLRGFSLEYRWKKKPEVIVKTRRTLADAVSMLVTIEAFEVVSVAREKGEWVFEGRRLRPRNMFQDEFEKLTVPVALRAGEGEKAG